MNSGASKCKNSLRLLQLFVSQQEDLFRLMFVGRQGQKPEKLGPIRVPCKR